MSVRAAPNYGRELLLHTLPRYLSLYQFLKNTGLLQHQSFLQLVILRVLLYANKYRRSNLDNHHELLLHSITSYRVFLVKRLQHAPYQHNPRSKGCLFVAYVLPATYLRSLSIVSVFITSAWSFNVVFPANQLINHSQHSLYSSFFGGCWEDIRLLSVSVHSPRSSTSSLDPIRDPILARQLKLYHAGFSRIRTSSASQVWRIHILLD